MMQTKCVYINTYLLLGQDIYINISQDIYMHISHLAEALLKDFGWNILCHHAWQ